MRNKIVILVIMLLGLTMVGANPQGCEGDGTNQPKSSSGAKKVTVKIKKDSSGFTVEQRNVANRLTMDNQPGSIKHLYIISAMSGDVIIYSTVRGKVTSSGKRLTPTSVTATDGTNVSGTHQGFLVNIGGKQRATGEVLQDDGTYGSSISYLYWWDSRGKYHQHYPGGGQIIHLSDQPMNFPKIILNLEADVQEKPAPTPAAAPPVTD